MNTSAGRQGKMGVNSVDMQKALIQQEEAYVQIVERLQFDRMRLRGANMTNRLNKMQRSNGAFNEYTKKQKEGNFTVARISRDEENQLVSAMKHIDQLKTSAKL